ncbi:hypothetical protein Pcinc_042328 [Petrolisthes cinctipes]|uniref:Uncharacterized protein n=1 Tax=Petrolisthes cinctipes TaxID=88211 RepID=A0AAE1EIY7_PETCI|nr:hypothetical protein Pcinc_042328 [Petrolisthes cinctipes]
MLAFSPSFVSLYSKHEGDRRKRGRNGTASNEGDGRKRGRSGTASNEGDRRKRGRSGTTSTKKTEGKEEEVGQQARRRRKEKRKKWDSKHEEGRKRGRSGTASTKEKEGKEEEVEQQATKIVRAGRKRAAGVMSREGTIIYLPIGVIIRSTVRKAARLAVYDDMMMRVKNHHMPPTILVDAACSTPTAEQEQYRIINVTK